MLEVVQVLKAYLMQFYKKYMVFVKQKTIQKKQVNEYKMTKRQINKKFNSLSKKKSNTKNTKKNLCQK